jgi:hypothetical protein
MTERVLEPPIPWTERFVDVVESGPPGALATASRVSWIVDGACGAISFGTSRMRRPGAWSDIVEAVLELTGQVAAERWEHRSEIVDDLRAVMPDGSMLLAHPGVMYAVTHRFGASLRALEIVGHQLHTVTMWVADVEHAVETWRLVDLQP